ncbi:SOD-1 superoxide dismutase (Cu-Zn), partial [Coemansia sp. RSA 475]
NHGAPCAADRHVGDLGNIVANNLGVAMVDFTDSQVSLMGAHSVLNRALVLHADADDLGKGGESDSLTTGHAGDRVACGVIHSI